MTEPIDYTPWLLFCDTLYPSPSQPCTLNVITVPCKCLLATSSLKCLKSNKKDLSVSYFYATISH